MLVITDQTVWSHDVKGQTYLFPGIKIDKSFIYEFGKNFYKEMDRYGRDHVVLKFPLNNTRITRKWRNNVRRLIYNEGFTTVLVWLPSNSLKIVEGEAEVCDIPDYNNVLGHYYLISARKNTVLKIRDGEQEMELVF